VDLQGRTLWYLKYGHHPTFLNIPHATERFQAYRNRPRKAVISKHVAKPQIRIIDCVSTSFYELELALCNTAARIEATYCAIYTPISNVKSLSTVCNQGVLLVREQRCHAGYFPAGISVFKAPDDDSPKCQKRLVRHIHIRNHDHHDGDFEEK
jgi:hypothetical protein